MRKRVDPIGRLLLRSGVLDEDGVADVLDSQRHTLPFASLAYVLGLCEEEPLVRAVSKQRGVPGLVLSRCVVNLSVLEGVPREVLLRHGIMPVLEDASRVFVAVEDPTNTSILREIGFLKGKAVVPHVALRISIARAIRRGYAALARGDTHWFGERATGREGPGSPGRMWVVSDVDELSEGIDTLREETGSEELTEITKELFDEDLNVEEAEDTTGQGDVSRFPTPTVDTPVKARASTDSASLVGSSVELVSAGGSVIDLDDGSPGRGPQAAPGAPARILIVDDDFATRHLLVKVLAPDGYVTDTAASGMEAVKRLRATPPDLVVIDIMLPEIDGFQICRSIKTSRKYRHIPVILLSAVIDSGRVTDDVLVRYGAEAYFEKPLNTERMRRRIHDLLGARSARAKEVDDRSFERALGLYKGGQVDEAIEELRKGLAVDPLSTKHHFVLANLLQKKNLVYEAIDEYEATVNLKPDYFPALSRLAYLYYKKGFSAKAIDTWRRSLPHCPDPTLRQNIEVFMRKLIADMQTEK